MFRDQPSLVPYQAHATVREFVVTGLTRWQLATGATLIEAENLRLTWLFGRDPDPLRSVVGVSRGLLQSFLGGVDHEVAISILFCDF